MTDSNTVDVMDDLNAFEAEFLGKPAQPTTNSATADDPKEDPEDTDADDTSPADDTSATEDDVDPSKDESDDNTDDDEQVEKPKKKQSVQERIDELTRARREAERRAEALEAKFAELEARTGKKEEAKAPTVATDNGAPDPDALNEDGTDKYPLGDYDPAYIKDLVRYENEQDRAAFRAEQEAALKEQEAHLARTALNTVWTEKLNAAETTDTMADIREVGKVLVEDFSDLDESYANYLGDTIMGLEKGPEVFYYLATHMEEARALVESGPTNATIALGEIQARLKGSSDGKQVKPKVTNAPEPPPRNKGNNARVETPDDTDDLDAFERKFLKKA